MELTSNGIPEIGTSPMDVFAVTLAVPLRSKVAELLSVTSANIASNAASLSDTRGTSWKLMGRDARFPVETPPTVSDNGRLS